MLAAHPLHALTDAEQARIRWQTMERLRVEDRYWRADYASLLRWKIASATPRTTDARGWRVGDRCDCSRNNVCEINEIWYT